jgi:hypothetical protein
MGSSSSHLRNRQHSDRARDVHRDDRSSSCDKVVSSTNEEAPPPPPGLWRPTVVQMKVFSVLNCWLKKKCALSDIGNDPECIQLLRDFLDDPVCTNTRGISAMISELKEVLKLIEKYWRRWNEQVKAIEGMKKEAASPVRVRGGGARGSNLLELELIDSRFGSGFALGQELNLPANRTAERPHDGDDQDYAQQWCTKCLLIQESLSLKEVHPSLHTTFSAKQIAEQMTLIEFDHYFRHLQPRELTNRSWSGQNKKVHSPNVVAMTELFQEVFFFFFRLSCMPSHTYVFIRNNTASTFCTGNVLFVSCFLSGRIITNQPLYYCRRLYGWPRKFSRSHFEQSKTVRMPYNSSLT